MWCYHLHHDQQIFNPQRLYVLDGTFCTMLVVEER